MIIPIESEPNKFLITLGTTVASVVWDGLGETVSDFKELLKLDEDKGLRTNDGKVGPGGVLFVGKSFILSSIRLNRTWTVTTCKIQSKAFILKYFPNNFQIQ